MLTTTAENLAAEGFALERGTGQRVQFWRRVDQSGADEGLIFETVSGRAFHVSDDGRLSAVLVACATVGLGAVAASTLPQAVKDEQTAIILDALEHI